jgi:hypothetical protein
MCRIFRRNVLLSSSGFHPKHNDVSTRPGLLPIVSSATCISLRKLPSVRRSTPGPQYYCPVRSGGPQTALQVVPSLYVRRRLHVHGTVGNTAHTRQRSMKSKTTEMLILLILTHLTIKQRILDINLFGMIPNTVFRQCWSEELWGSTE